MGRITGGWRMIDALPDGCVTAWLVLLAVAVVVAMVRKAASKS